MRRIMLIGENGVGRRSLARALGFALLPLQRPMAVEYAGPFVFPPPEFLENRRFYRALITTSMECGVLLLLQDATRRTSVFPPGFARIFNRRVIGVVTKTDSPDADPVRARRFLQNAGLQCCHAISVEGNAPAEATEALHALRAELFPPDHTQAV